MEQSTGITIGDLLVILQKLNPQIGLLIKVTGRGDNGADLYATPMAYSLAFDEVEGAVVFDTLELDFGPAPEEEIETNPAPHPAEESATPPPPSPETRRKK
jgi:hypothetical protein